MYFLYTGTQTDLVEMRDFSVDCKLVDTVKEVPTAMECFSETEDEWEEEKDNSDTDYMPSYESEDEIESQTYSEKIGYVYNFIIIVKLLQCSCTWNNLIKVLVIVTVVIDIDT